MKLRPELIVTLALLVGAPGIPTLAAGLQGFEDISGWWNEPYPQPLDVADLDFTLDTIRVDGNRFVDDDGNTVIFRGVSIADPDKLEKNGRWAKSHFEAVKSWGANIVRLPVHPVAWRERDRDRYFELLDQAVTWATELEIYLLIDWHSIGNPLSGMFQHSMYKTSEQEAREFWRAVSHRYQGIPTIAFYEIYNEPTTYSGQLGWASWDDWTAFNEEIISIIRAHNDDTVPLVAGWNWAYELHHVKDDPIEAEGIGYVTHPYPQKVEPPYEEKWERDFGYVADTYPVFATEFGFTRAENPDAHIPVIGGPEYGEEIIDYFEKKGISWAAWCFDPNWGPWLISDWDYTPTEQGAFFRAKMSVPGLQDASSHQL
jgi:aryl-phospho-beta-D-glucosidase BglC (GH1 family)